MSVQTLEGQSQDGPVHSGSKGRGTVTSASLPILEKLLWARTLEVLGLCFIYDKLHEIFTFSTDSFPNQGKSEWGEM